MKNKIHEAIKRYNMICRGDRILAALSGGADSVTLLHYLFVYRDILGITVEAAHVNHMLRGKEADRDELFCRSLCENMGIKLHVKKIDVRKIAKDKGLSEELCGRNIRYEFFDEIVNNSGMKIATAHTLSDSIETMIFNLARGTGLKGLCGIPPVRKNIIRPLINCYRSDIENYCKEHNLDYVTDSTNLEDDYSRNFIRHNILPQLKNINIEADKALGRTINWLREDENYLSLMAGDMLEKIKTDDNKYDIHDLIDCPVPVKRRVIAKILKNNCGNISSEHILELENLLNKTGSVNLPKDLKAKIKDGFLIITPQNEDINNSARFNERVIKLEESIQFAEKTIYLQNLSIKDYNFLKFINKKLFYNCFDCDMIYGDYKCRTRLDGDYYHPLLKGCGKSLKKLFNELKISKEERTKRLILCDNNGIIWVEGIGIDERVKITDKTKNIVLININGNNSLI